MSKPKILIIGANGQIGTELTAALAQRYGRAAVISSDLAPAGRCWMFTTKCWTLPRRVRWRKWSSTTR